MTKCDRSIEEVREAGRVGAVAPFQQLVSDSRRTWCRLVQGFGKVHQDFFGGDGGEAPAEYWKGVIGVGRRDRFQDMGKNLSDRTCLISVVGSRRFLRVMGCDWLGSRDAKLRLSTGGQVCNMGGL